MYCRVHEDDNRSLKDKDRTRQTAGSKRQKTKVKKDVAWFDLLWSGLV